jgi:triacylglycerol lipase
MLSRERMIVPVRAFARAATRVGTYPGQLREAAALVVTVAHWPSGLRLGRTPDPLDAGESATPAIVWTPDSYSSAAGPLPADVDGRQTRLPFEGLTPPRPAPVLLVHGFGANTSNWHVVTRELRRSGFDRIHSFDYNPFAADVATLAARCAEAAEDLRRRLGVERIHLIGHSLGGVIARYAVEVCGLEGVDLCITIAAPHGGADVSRLAALLPSVDLLRSARDLWPGSPMLRALWSAAPSGATRFVAYYSNLDVIVPASRAQIRPPLAARNILVKDHGHLSIMYARALTASMVELLLAAEREAAALEVGPPRVDHIDLAALPLPRPLGPGDPGHSSPGEALVG